MRQLRGLASGSLLLFTMAIGLWGYAAWRWTEAIRSPEHRTWFQRTQLVVRGAIYGFLGIEIVRFVLAGNADSHPAREFTSQAITSGFGRAVL